jgi:hypothetical protein
MEIIIRKPTGAASSSSADVGMWKVITPFPGSNQGSINITGTISPVINGAVDDGTHPIFIPDSISYDETYMVQIMRDMDRFRMYVNGELQGDLVFTAVLSPNSNPLLIGGSPDFPNSYQFHGFISDVALYDHALTVDRCLAHAVAAGLA